VLEHRLHPLLPLGALMQQRVPAADPGTKVQEVRGCDPRLRQPLPISSSSRRCRASAQSLLARLPRPFKPLVWTTSARCTSAPKRSRSSATNPPPRRRLQRDLEAPPLNWARNLRTPARSAGATRAGDLAGDRVGPLRRDLRDADPSPSPATCEHHPLDSPEISDMPSSSQTRRASHTVNHGRYLLFDWPAAWLQPRAPSHAVRRGGPATFTARVTPTST
jgi:hypothetical protein